MLQRKWIPNDKVIESESKITIYDAGSYFCEMVDPSQYGCWEVVSRETTNNTVTEVLKPAPEDWVPFDIISTESYPVNLIEGGYEITGWTILQLTQQPSQQPLRPPQQQQQLPQQGGQQQAQRSQLPSQRQGQPRPPSERLPQRQGQPSEFRPRPSQPQARLRPQPSQR